MKNFQNINLKNHNIAIPILVEIRLHSIKMRLKKIMAIEFSNSFKCCFVTVVVVIHSKSKQGSKFKIKTN